MGGTTKTKTTKLKTTTTTQHTNTLRDPVCCSGEASLPIQIPFTDGSYGSNLIDLTKK